MENFVYAPHLENQILDRLDIMSHNGVTFFTPVQQSHSVTVEMSVLKQNLILDYFKICNLLEREIIVDEYLPHYLDVFRSNEKHPENALYDYFADKHCPFLQHEESKRHIIDAIKQFVLKYGSLIYATNERKRERTSFDELSSFFYSVANECALDNMYYWFRTPLSMILYLLYDSYFRYTYPTIYKHKIDEIDIEKHSNNYPHETIYMKIHSWYDMDGEWHTLYRVRSLIDIIKFFLFCDNSMNVIRCAHCEAFFIPKNDRTIYCSSTCRNRANVKRSYEKKRGISNGNDNQTK